MNVFGSRSCASGFGMGASSSVPPASHRTPQPQASRSSPPQQQQLTDLVYWVRVPRRSSSHAANQHRQKGPQGQSQVASPGKERAIVPYSRPTSPSEDDPYDPRYVWWPSLVCRKHDGIMRTITLMDGGNKRLKGKVLRERLSGPWKGRFGGPKNDGKVRVARLLGPTTPTGTVTYPVIWNGSPESPDLPASDDPHVRDFFDNMDDFAERYGAENGGGGDSGDATNHDPAAWTEAYEIALSGIFRETDDSDCDGDDGTPSPAVFLRTGEDGDFNGSSSSQQQPSDPPVHHRGDSQFHSQGVPPEQSGQQTQHHDDRGHGGSKQVAFERGDDDVARRMDKDLGGGPPPAAVADAHGPTFEVVEDAAGPNVDHRGVRSRRSAVASSAENCGAGRITPTPNGAGATVEAFEETANVTARPTSTKKSPPQPGSQVMDLSIPTAASMGLSSARNGGGSVHHRGRASPSTHPLTPSPQRQGGSGDEDDIDTVMTTHSQVQARDDEEKHRLVQTNMEPHCKWKTAWDLLRRNGWTSRKAERGSMVDKYYIRPRFADASSDEMKSRGRLGNDYFTTLEGLHRYCREEYGWEGSSPADAAASSSLIPPLAPARAASPMPPAPTRAAPVPSPATTAASSTISQAIRPDMEWKEVSAALETYGWGFVKGDGLVSYFYVKPPYRGRRDDGSRKTRGGIEAEGARRGVDYFDTDQLMDYCRTTFGWVGPDDGRDGIAAEPASSSRRAARKSITKQHPPVVVTKAKAKKAAKVKAVIDLSNNSPVPAATTPRAKSARAAPSPATTVSSTVSKAIAPDMKWKEVTAALKTYGWSYMRGGLLISYYYVTPRFKGKKKGEMLREGVENEDYFGDEDQLKAYCFKKFGWEGGRMFAESSGGRRRSREAATKVTAAPVAVAKTSGKKEAKKAASASNAAAVLSTPIKKRPGGHPPSSASPVAAAAAAYSTPNKKRPSRQPKSPAAAATPPPAPTPTSSANVSSRTPRQSLRRTVRPRSEWKDVINFLFDAGWSYITGDGLAAFFYVSPQCSGYTKSQLKKERQRGMDYFDEDELKRFVRDNYGWLGEGGNGVPSPGMGKNVYDKVKKRAASSRPTRDAVITSRMVEPPPRSKKKESKGKDKGAEKSKSKRKDKSKSSGKHPQSKKQKQKQKEPEQLPRSYTSSPVVQHISVAHSPSGRDSIDSSPVVQHISVAHSPSGRDSIDSDITGSSVFGPPESEDILVQDGSDHEMEAILEADAAEEVEESKRSRSKKSKKKDVRGKGKKDGREVDKKAHSKKKPEAKKKLVSAKSKGLGNSVPVEVKAVTTSNEHFLPMKKALVQETLSSSSSYSSEGNAEISTLPTWASAWQLLRGTFKFRQYNDIYCLPGHGPDRPHSIKDVHYFQYNHKLRKHLCKYGIPGGRDCLHRLTRAEKKSLERWIRVSIVNTVDINTVELPDCGNRYTNWKMAWRTLQKLGYKYASGEYRYPGAKAKDRYVGKTAFDRWEDFEESLCRNGVFWSDVLKEPVEEVEILRMEMYLAGCKHVDVFERFEPPENALPTPAPKGEAATASKVFHEITSVVGAALAKDVAADIKDAGSNNGSAKRASDEIGPTKNVVPATEAGKGAEVEEESKRSAAANQSEDGLAKTMQGVLTDREEVATELKHGKKTESEREVEHKDVAADKEGAGNKNSTAKRASDGIGPTKNVIPATEAGKGAEVEEESKRSAAANQIKDELAKTIQGVLTDHEEVATELKPGKKTESEREAEHVQPQPHHKPAKSIADSTTHRNNEEQDEQTAITCAAHQQPRPKTPIHAGIHKRGVIGFLSPSEDESSTSSAPIASTLLWRGSDNVAPVGLLTQPDPEETTRTAPCSGHLTQPEPPEEDKARPSLADTAEKTPREVVAPDDNREERHSNVTTPSEFDIDCGPEFDIDGGPRTSLDSYLSNLANSPSAAASSSQICSGAKTQLVFGESKHATTAHENAVPAAVKPETAAPASSEPEASMVHDETEHSEALAHSPTQVETEDCAMVDESMTAQKSAPVEEKACLESTHPSTEDRGNDAQAELSNPCAIHPVNAQAQDRSSLVSRRTPMPPSAHSNRQTTCELTPLKQAIAANESLSDLIVESTGEKGTPVQPDDEWPVVHAKMMDCGWTWRQGKFPVEDIYVLPNGKYPGGKLGEDYVEEVLGMKQWAAKNLGWKGDNDVREAAMQASSKHARRRRNLGESMNAEAAREAGAKQGPAKRQRMVEETIPEKQRQQPAEKIPPKDAPMDANKKSGVDEQLRASTKAKPTKRQRMDEETIPERRRQQRAEKIPTKDAPLDANRKSGVDEQLRASRKAKPAMRQRMDEETIPERRRQQPAEKITLKDAPMNANRKSGVDEQLRASRKAKRPAETSVRKVTPSKKSARERLHDCLRALHPSCTVEKMAFVSSPFSVPSPMDQVMDFMQSFSQTYHDASQKDTFVRMKKCFSLYCCGGPGTGKTSTVLHCMREVERQAEESTVTSCKPVAKYFNVAHVPSSEAVYKEIAQILQAPADSKPPALKTMLAQGIHSVRARSKPFIVLILDEIDSLLSQAREDSSSQNDGERLLQTLLEWASDPTCAFGLVGLSNSVDNKAAKRLHSLGKIGETIVFPTYREGDLLEILNARVGDGVIASPALQLVSRKIAATHGDARKALDLTSKAVSNCLGSLTEEQLNSTSGDLPLVKVSHMMRAIRADSVGVHAVRIAGLPQAAKIILCVAVALSQVSSDWKLIRLNSLKTYCMEASQHGLLDGLSLDHFQDLIEQLSDAGLLITGAGANDPSDDILAQLNCDTYDRPLQLGVQLDDVEIALEKKLMNERFYKRLVEYVKETNISNRY